MATTFKKHSTTEISNSFSLWQEFADPGATMSKEEFDTLSTQEKNKMQREMFPGECDDVDADGNVIE